MAGTKAGGKKTAETNKKKHGDNFYSELGRKGGDGTPSKDSVLCITSRIR